MQNVKAPPSLPVPANLEEEEIRILLSILEELRKLNGSNSSKESMTSSNSLLASAGSMLEGVVPGLGEMLPSLLSVGEELLPMLLGLL